MSDSLPLHGLQDPRLPCPSFTISWRLLKLMSFELVIPSNHLILCHPLLLPWIFPSIRVFSSESGLHISDQSIGASTSASVYPMCIQDWFPLGLTGLISLQKGLSRVFSSTTVQKHQFFSAQPMYRWFHFPFLEKRGEWWITWIRKEVKILIRYGNTKYYFCRGEKIIKIIMRQWAII